MDFSNLKNCLDGFLEKYHVPGLDCIVCQNHQELFRYTPGYREVEKKTPMNGEELYLIFSMTKMLTCTCVLQLLEKEMFALDDPISLYLPEFATMRIATEEDGGHGSDVFTGKTSGETVRLNENGFAKNPITVRTLLNMSAGLNYDLKAEGILRSLKEGKTSTREIVRALAETTLAFEPGTSFRYSLCHDVLGALIEIWSGQKFSDYLREHLLEPLGMKNTFFGIPEDKERLSKMMPRYAYNAEGIPVLQPLECVYSLEGEYESGGAGLTSCPEDYALFLDALACGGIGKTGNKILSPESIALMKENHLTEKGQKTFEEMGRQGYSYGFGVRTHIVPELSGSSSPVGEFGWDGAAGGFSMVDTEKQLSLTYFQEVHGWKVEFQTELLNALYSCFD